MFKDLPKEKFDIIYLDPPWDYKSGVQHGGANSGRTSAALDHYSTVKLKDLKTLSIKSIASDTCLMFMWATNPHLDQAIDLGKSWGFSYSTVAFVWNKMRVNPGYYTMSQVELCLLFKLGKIPTPRGARNIRQYVEAKRREHSRKPDEVRERIEQMFPDQSKIELFAREVSDGWTSWGNEV